MNLIATAACTLAMLLFTSSVQAEARLQSTDQQCAEIRMATLYLTHVTEFEPLDICPTIIFQADSPLATGPVADRLLFSTEGTAYFLETGAILLPVSLDLNTPEGFGSLLHHLVRVYQFNNGMTQQVTCNAALTKQAFDVQARYLSDNGLAYEADQVALTGKYRAMC